MSTDTVQALVDDYVRRLQAALRDLPRDRRREIVDELVTHVDAALEELPAHDEASVRTVLDRVGDPDDIAADARDRFGLAPPRPTVLEPITIVLLLFGGFLCGVGWLAGVVLLWVSGVWTRGQKILATLLFPGGLVVAPYLALATATRSNTCVSSDGFRSCTSNGVNVLVQALLFVVVVLAVAGPIVSAVVLARRLREVRAATA